MLSIDITDRQIKLVRGAPNGSKIKIEEVDYRDITVGMIANGYIADIPIVAAEIIDIIKTRGIKEKDAIVSISSSSILYKELLLQKPKRITNSAAIEAMIASNMGITNEYNVSYSIVGQTVDENKTPLIKVLATACPQRLVDGYVRLFTHLGLTLKAINISNNSISRLIQNTPKMSGYMPLLLIQIDKEFLNFNLYEEGTLAFSRYFKIDAADYNNAPDYINQAVYDNLFRMFQFFQTRKDSKPIKEIMFYGEIGDFISLSNAISSFNISNHILSTPTTIASRADFDFTKFANAIGAIYKVNKDLEHINLLDSTAAKEKKGLNTFFIALGGAALASVAVVAVANIIVNNINNDIVNKTIAVRAEIEDPEIQARNKALNEKIGVLNNFKSYESAIGDAERLFNWRPKATTDVLTMLQEPFTKNIANTEGLTFNPTEDAIKTTLNGMKMVGNCNVSGYNVSATFEAKNTLQPAVYIEHLKKQGFFTNIQYTGFTLIDKNTGESVAVNKTGGNVDIDLTDQVVSFQINCLLLTGSDVKPTKDEVEKGLAEVSVEATDETSDETTGG